MSTERIVALLFGVIFILVGIAGFIPALVVNGNLLLGIFEVNAHHNAVHLVSGVIALLAAAQTTYSKLYFQIFGIVYAIVAILGFVMNGNLILMHVNMADNILHIAIAIVALWIGFLFHRTV
jgi:hypothetical protein